MSTSPPSDSRIPVELFDRYLAGNCTPEEQALVQASVAKNPDVATLARMMREEPVSSRCLWEHFDTSGRMVAPSPMDKTPARLAAEGRHGANRRSFDYGSRGIRRYVMMGSAAAVLACATGFWLMRGPGRQQPSRTHEYVTQYGEYTTVTLPDSSAVTLAPATRLHYTESYSGERLITLEGQAQFTVTPHSRRTFTVRTGNIATRVLGTVFDVRRYPSDSATSVIVLSGKVSSEGEKSTVLLSAGMLGQITDSSSVAKTIPDVETLTAWTKGRLVFKNTSVQFMLDALSRWYGYEFRLADSTLGNQRVSAVLLMHRSEETLSALQDMLDVTADIRGKVITLRRRTSSQHPALPVSARNRDVATLTPRVK